MNVVSITIDLIVPEKYTEELHEKLENCTKEIGDFVKYTTKFEVHEVELYLEP